MRLLAEAAAIDCSIMPDFSGRQVVKAFQEAGWRQVRQRGSHLVMLKEGSNVSFSKPQHREVSPGTLRTLIRLSGMTAERFCKLL